MAKQFMLYLIFKYLSLAVTSKSWQFINNKIKYITIVYLKTGFPFILIIYFLACFFYTINYTVQLSHKLFLFKCH